MFANYLATALRNLERNGLYAAISILGLSVAFASAILIAQFVRAEFSYDRWIPGYQHVYKITDTLQQPGGAPMQSDITQSDIAGRLKLAFPGKVVVARLMQEFPEVRHRPGDPGLVDQGFAWADPDFFAVLPLPVLSGDLKTALLRPDTVVITRDAARRYFGRDLPIGETLDVLEDGQLHPMQVTAVLRDLPANTTLVTQIFASAGSAYSPLTGLDAHPLLGEVTNYTFARLAANQTGADLQRALDAAGRPELVFFARLGGGTRFSFGALPLAQSHLHPVKLRAIVVKPPGSTTTTDAIGTMGLLIVVVAAINFVTLMTARAARRAIEVGVRKVSGATRSDLIIQFMGEALIQVGLAVLIAAVLAEVLVKPFGAFVQRDLGLDFIHDPTLLGGALALTVGIGLLAGFYPALVLSSFRPAAVLKGGLAQTAGSAVARQTLVVIQFAIMIGFILTTMTIYRQTQFALKQGIGAHSNLMVGVWTPCRNAFPNEVRRLPGVQAAACSSLQALGSPAAKSIAPVQTRGGGRVNFDMGPVDYGFFELFDIRPLAGRLFSRDHGEDNVLSQPGTASSPTVVLNETAARGLGYADPRAAVGRQMMWIRSLSQDGPAAPAPAEIIGVVPDTPASVRTAAEPTFYFIDPQHLGMLVIRMTGRDMPGTVRSIERVWKATGNTRPIQEVFLSQYELSQYFDIVIQGVAIAISSVLAVVIACLGLFALSAFITERRTKEIGIRKAMGATTFDVVRLLMWQFTVPVLAAIAIALPLSFLVMDNWLRDFAYHVDLAAWTFVLAAVVALGIAWVTVSLQTFMVARAKPVTALRYE